METSPRPLTRQNQRHSQFTKKRRTQRSDQPPLISQPTRPRPRPHKAPPLAFVKTPTPPFSQLPEGSHTCSHSSVLETNNEKNRGTVRGKMEAARGTRTPFRSRGLESKRLPRGLEALRQREGRLSRPLASRRSPSDRPKALQLGPCPSGSTPGTLGQSQEGGWGGGRN